MAECTALACLRLKNTDYSSRVLSVHVPSSQISKDVTGCTWCNYCQKQRLLMNWGYEHHWTDVHASGVNSRYAIAADKDEWYISIACSCQDAIDAYYAEVIGVEAAA